MSRLKRERNIAWDTVRQCYYITLRFGMDDAGKTVKQYKVRKTLKEARALLAEHEYNRAQNNVVTRNRITLKDYMTYWIEDIKPQECRPTTLYAYRNIVYKHMMPNLGHMQLQEIDAQHINKYCSRVQKQCGLSNNTINKHKALLHNFFDHAVAEKIILHNCMECVKKSKPEEVYNLEQVKELLATIKGHRLELGVKLALYLGVRKSEVMGLTWDNVDLENNVLYIKEARVLAGSTDYISTPKSKYSIRKLSIEGDLLGLLKQTKANQKAMKQIKSEEYNPYDFVICC